MLCENMEDKFVGKRLDGRYEIHELVGVGGMAYVYRAYDRMEDRWVAIKILKEEYSNDSEFLRRFRNESKAIAVLSHPNIVKIYDVSFGDQIQYIVMEYIDGITLKHYIEQEGALRWQETVHFISQILSALELAHDHGIIHRDIKPQNILLLRDGTIKVTDFGIARFLQNETQTMTDKAIGSVHYISPEQASGHKITNKADIYSTGIVLYEMITGRLPFVADTAVSVVIMQIQNAPVPPREINPDIPYGLEQITLKAMEKNPENRFSSASVMLDDILDFKQDPSITFNYNSYTYRSVQRSGGNVQSNIDDYNTVGETHAYGDGYDEEYDPELVRSRKRRKGSMAITGIIIALIIVLVSVGAVYIIDLLKEEEVVVEDSIEMPNFLGMIYETEIQGNKLYIDFEIKTKEGNDPTKQPGEVLYQDVDAGLRVKKGREVTLTVNKSEGEKVTVPPLKGYEQTAAINALSAMSLKYKLETIADDEIEVGHVVKTDPAEGSVVSEGSTITLYVSTGSSIEKVKVPSNLVGDIVENVTAKIEDAKLVPTIVYDDESDKPKGTVISVSPDSGTELSVQSSVTITVSSGKGVEKTLDYSVDLPYGVNEDIVVKVYRNGSLFSQETVNPAYVSTYNLSFTGKSGIEKIVIKLNDQDYMFIDFDFTNETKNVTAKYDYTPQTSGDDSSNSEESSDGDE